MAADGPQFRLRTLGELALYRRGEQEPRVRNAKALALIAFLALRPDHRARRPYLARLLWPDADRTKRLRSLRQALYYLTDRTERDLFRRGDGVLALREECLEVDLWSFDRALENGEYERVASLYGGQFLEGFDADVSRELRHWREAETERIWSGLKLAYRRLVSGKLGAGQPDEAIRYAREYRDLNPLDGRARKLVVHALVADDRKVEAYQEYEQYATLLEEQLDEEPSEELEDRAREVRELLIEDRVEETPGDGDAPIEAQFDGTVSEDRAVLQYGALGVAILVLAGVLWYAGETSGGSGAFSTVDADVLLLRQGEDRQWTAQLRAGRVAGLTALNRYRRALPRPGHAGQAAVTMPGPTGVDMGLADFTVGDTTRLTDRPFDELPLDFSPDGRLLLYDHGTEVRDGERYDLYATILDLASGERRLVASDTLREVRGGDWSPYGPRLALSARSVEDSRDIWVLTVDGRTVRNVSAHPAPDRDPAWSPEANWIAFTSRRAGNREIFMVRPDGSELRQITRHPAPDRAPVWLSRYHLAFLSERGGGSDLWGFYLPTGERRQLTRVGDLTDLRGTDLLESGRWIDSVEIRPDRDRVVAGEFLRLRAVPFDAKGRRHEQGTAAVRWTHSADAGLVPHRDGTIYRARPDLEGPIRIGASAGGWRSETVRLGVAEVERHEADVEFAEDWDGDPLAERWIGFGRPMPVVREVANARFRRSVDPNGDEHFDSGLATADPLPLRGGAAVSFWARAEFTQPLYQVFKVSLTPDPPAEGETSWRGRSGGAGFGVNSGAPGLQIVVSGHRVRLPLMTVSPDDWHRYTLQVGREGTVWMLVDGQLLWRSENSIDLAQVPEAHLVLHGRSDATTIEFGPLRVYGEPRFELSE